MTSNTGCPIGRNGLIPTERITQAILLIRGHKVMLDADRNQSHPDVPDTTSKPATLRAGDNPGTVRECVVEPAASNAVAAATNMLRAARVARGK